MDFGVVEEKPGDDEKLLKDIHLDVFNVDPDKLNSALDSVAGGSRIKEWIAGNSPNFGESDAVDEFGG